MAVRNARQGVPKWVLSKRVQSLDKMHCSRHHQAFTSALRISNIGTIHVVFQYSISNIQAAQRPVVPVSHRSDSNLGPCCSHTSANHLPIHQQPQVDGHAMIPRVCFLFLQESPSSMKYSWVSCCHPICQLLPGRESRRRCPPAPEATPLKKHVPLIVLASTKLLLSNRLWMLSKLMFLPVVAKKREVTTWGT